MILSFAANWGFPIMAGILAGDMFAGEDRQGTWKTILTRSRSPEEMFAGKVPTAPVLPPGLALILAVARSAPVRYSLHPGPGSHACCVL